MKSTELYRLKEGLVITDISVSQEFTKSCRIVSISVSDDNQVIDVIRLYAPNDLDSIGEIFEACHFWVEKAEETQMEFGTITLGFSGESYIEIIFDSVEINHQIT